MRTCSRSPSSTPIPVPSLVELEHWATASRQGESSSGNVSLFYAGETFRAFSGGNGPVDALLSAVDNALEQIIGGRPQLVDYGLRSVGAGEDAQGEATVKIAAPTGDTDVPRIFTGHGLSTNVVEASLRAYLAAINKLIAEHAEVGEPAGDGRGAARDGPPRGATSPGDGIGPEVCAVARRCVDALGDRFGYEVSGSSSSSAGRRWMPWHPAPRRDPRRCRRRRCRAARRRWRPGLGRSGRTVTSGGRAAGPALEPRAVREPAARARP